MNIHATHRSLETAHYFDALEAQIVQRLREEADSKISRANLLRSTGIEDTELVEELVKLGITADEVITLRLIPLVMVAWAEDHVDMDERDVVKAEAKQLGISEDSTAWIILDTWLRKEPPGISVDAWRRYTHDTFSGMSPKSIANLIRLTEAQMTAVAKASGGQLWFGRVSQKEAVMIKRLTRIMREQQFMLEQTHQTSV